MSDAKPYTLGELAEDGWKLAYQVAPEVEARIRATAEALAAARRVVLECLNTDVAGELTEQAKDAAMAWLYPDSPARVPMFPEDKPGSLGFGIEEDPRWKLHDAELKSLGIPDASYR